MTICGFALGGGVGWAWADAEAYSDDGEPTGRDVEKLGVAEGALVICGAGWRTIVAEIAVTAYQLKSGAATANLAKLMSLASGLSRSKRACFERSGIPWSADTRFGAILIDEGGRLRGLTMHEAEDFVPRRCDAWSLPGVGRVPTCAADVEAIARDQIGIVRREIPRATGRALTVAKIGPRGVATAKMLLPDMSSPSR